jgi:hypothetical protein
MLRTSLTAAEDLLALEQGQAGEAVERLSAAIKAEREASFVYGAACLELDLARGLEAQAAKTLPLRRGRVRLRFSSPRCRERVLAASHLPGSTAGSADGSWGTRSGG